MRWQVGVGISPETPGGLNVDESGSTQPPPLLGRVSDVTASQDDELILGEHTQVLWRQNDEETS